MQVLQMQYDIATAWKCRNMQLVSELQQKLVRSFAARALAVRKVVTNPGRNTPGIDGVVLKNPKLIAQVMESLKDLSNYKASPVRRVYIPKPDGRKRPLGIPTMKDRAVQALFNMALLPIAESVADKRSYGYRPYRSVHDVAIYTKLVAGAIYGKRWVLEGDIKGFFDNLSHDWLLKNIPMDKKILHEFLKAGFLEGNDFHETELGTPQGGIISPTIANMALDGLERIANGVSVVRYADDFVILGQSKQILLDIMPALNSFLAERGLTLNMEKTKLVSIEEGFDFVGFHFREYPDLSRVKGWKKGIFLVKAKKKSVSNFKHKIKLLVKSHYQKPIHLLISALNPILRGWAEHYRSVTSTRLFSAMGRYVWTLIWRMLVRRYRGIPLRELRSKHFITVDGNRWVLQAKDSKGKQITLYQMGWTNIKRHTLCPDLNPFDPANAEIFAKRLATGARQSVLANKLQGKLANLQKGVCPVCKSKLYNGETLEVHHRLARKLGGDDTLKNLLLVHKLCHDQVTYCMDKNLRAAFVSEGIIIVPKKPTETKKPNKIISLKELSKPRKKPTR